MTQNHMCLNWKFWYELGREIGWQEENQLDKGILSRWVSVLLSTMPSSMSTDARDHVLWGLAKQCNRHELLEDLVQVFDSMLTSQLVLRDMEGFNPKLTGKHHSLNEIWEEMLKPEIDRIADTVLIRIVCHLEEQYLSLKSWGKANRGWDISSERRPAIESVQQNRYPEPIDVLIDATRDCLEFLASKKPEQAKCWCNKLVASEAPLLRRLAVHAFFKIKNISADDKIDWLLKNIGLYNQPVRNEVLKAIKRVYLDTGQQCRENVVEAVLAHEAEGEQHDWLYRLHRAVPECKIIKDALDNIQDKHPELKQMEHPDWDREVEGKYVQSFWTAELLLEKPPGEQFQDLLTFQGELGLGRGGLVSAVQEATNSNPSWGMELAETLDEAGEWGSDLWKGLIRAWAETKLDEVSHRKVLSWLSKSKLYLEHQLGVAKALCALVEHGGAPYTFKLLNQANQIAKTLWGCLDETEKVPKEMPPNGWLGHAINHPAGALTLFWLMSLSVWRKNQDSVPDSLSDEYRDMLSKIVRTPSLVGRLGRTVMASQFHFLLATDDKWTKGNILPLFKSDDDFQAVWDGFLTWGYLTPDTAPALSAVFLEAVQKIKGNLIPQKDRFVGFYASMLESFVENRSEWIDKLFHYGDQVTRRHFAFAIDYELRERDSEQRQGYWQRWLKKYWEKRLEGVPATLKSREVDIMLNWLPLLECVFPEAVDLACRMPQCTEADQILHDLESEDELIKSHPEEIVKLLLYLENSVPSYLWPTISKVIKKIPQEKISSELKKELKELKVRLGLD